MGSFRYETTFASQYFIDSLRFAGRLGRMIQNGTDIVWFALPDGTQVSAHFIDNTLPLYEIRSTFAGNAVKGIATLYLLWADMMLPSNGQVYRVDDWMEALYTVYGDTIYAYEVENGTIALFPVYFRGEGLVRRAEYGGALDFTKLSTRGVRAHLAGLHGEFRVADFGGTTGKAHDPVMETARTAGLREDYTLLGIAPTQDRAAVKAAYRTHARRLHPDTSAAPDAHEQMQRLNHAYARIVKALDAQTHGSA